MGLFLTSIKHHNDPVAFVGNGVLAVAAIVLVAVTAGRGAARRGLIALSARDGTPER
jgi:hypothetical protein